MSSTLKDVHDSTINLKAYNVLCSDGASVQSKFDNLSSNNGRGVSSLIVCDLIKGTINQVTSIVSEDASSDMVLMRSTSVVPFFGCTLRFSLPADISAKVYYGNTENRSGATTKVSKNVSANIADGGTFSFPINKAQSNIDQLRNSCCYYYRIAFIKNGISVEEVQNKLDSGEIQITYAGINDNVISRNENALAKVGVLSQTITSPFSEQSIGMAFNNIIVHISDIHSDMLRCNNAMDIADYIKSDAMLMTGDFVAECAYDGLTWPIELAKKHNTLQIVTSGNHDGIGKSSHAIPELYTPFYNRYGYSRNGMYYYKDISSAKLRIIALDCSDGEYINNLTETQLQYLANAMLNTPAGYGIVVALHQPPTADLTTSSKDTYKTFLSGGNNSAFYLSAQGATITNIVDAFIGGTSVTISGSTFNFANKATGAEFIMYCCGHAHADNIGYLQGPSRTQLMCQIGNDNIDFGKGFTCEYVSKGLGNLPNQDLINVYAINRLEKIISVVRIGCDFTTKGAERKVMLIPYA